MASDGARIPAQPESMWTDEAREQLSAGTPDGKPRSSSFLQTLAWQPRLYKRWAAFAGTLLTKGTLPGRTRELAALRLLWATQCGYEWAEHVRIAHAQAVSSEEIDAIARGAVPETLSASERGVLSAVDELREQDSIGEDTWLTLEAGYDEGQLVELLLLIGNYQLVSWFMNVVRCAPPEGNRGLEAR